MTSRSAHQHIIMFLNRPRKAYAPPGVTPQVPSRASSPFCCRPSKSGFWSFVLYIPSRDGIQIPVIVRPIRFPREFIVQVGSQVDPRNSASRSSVASLLCRKNMRLQPMRSRAENSAYDYPASDVAGHPYKFSRGFVLVSS